MPQYPRPPENWNNRGKIKITFRPFWRNIPILRDYPFWVGDVVKFHIHTENPGTNYMFHDAVHQMIGNSLINQFDIQQTDTNIEGIPIASEGDLKFSLGIINMPVATDASIITANVQNKDRWWLGCIGLLIGAILSLCVGVLLWLLGFIKIDPAWVLKIIK